MPTATTWVWIKAGDCVAEGSQLVATFVAEMGQASASDVNVRVGRTLAGDPLTLLIADHDWWKEQMRVHPNGWNGASLEAVFKKVGL